MTANDWRWPSIDVVRALHAKLINDFGGLHGEGGPGDLDAVLVRPANLADYGECARATRPSSLRSTA